jgi:uncharacterized DUF497 family protein
MVVMIGWSHKQDPAVDDFEWDDANIEHVARHGVTPTEAEDAILDPRRIAAVARSTPSERRTGIVGETEAGRLLFVAFTARQEMIRVVTAYDASERQRRQYRRRR